MSRRGREKHMLLRARALALRDRVVVLAYFFTHPDVQPCIAGLLRGVDDELAWLDRFGAVAPLPHVETFLAGTAVAVGLLEQFSTPDRRKISLALLLTNPALAQALADARAEAVARDARPSAPPEVRSDDRADDAR